MSKIKILTSEHAEEAYDLASYAFNFEQDNDAKEKFRAFFHEAETVGAFQENKLDSQLLVLPLDIYIHGETMAMGGISYVSSYPEARGMGNIKRLFEETLDQMNRKGMVLSYLDPFSYPFYRKFGYEVAFNTVLYEIEASNLPKTENYSGKVIRTEWTTEKESFKNMYHEKYVETVGPLKRSDWIWEQKFSRNENQKSAIYKDEENRPKGYVLYHVTKTDAIQFVIDEFVYLSQDAFIGLWQFIGSHQNAFDTFRYWAGEDEYITDLFPTLKVKKEIKPFMMARIINIESFLLQYPFKNKAQTTLYLRVLDDMASWNQGLWKLELRNTGRKVTKVVSGEDVKETDILSASIQTWTQFFMNYRTMQGLHFHRRVIGDYTCARELQKRIPTGTPQLYNFF